MSEHRCKGWVAFLIGGLVGAVAGLALAPRSGKETREIWRRKGEDLKEKAEEPKEKAGDSYLVAHYEPDHRILGWVAPHFTRRLGDTSWAILTPDASVTCDRGQCHFGPGVRLLSSEDPDDIAALWCRYYRTTFNRERANTTLLDKNLPQRYRKHLT